MAVPSSSVCIVDLFRNGILNDVRSTILHHPQEVKLKPARGVGPRFLKMPGSVTSTADGRNYEFEDYSYGEI